MGKRIYSLDFLKSFSMILVIVIHMSNYYCRNTNDLNSVNFIFSLIYNGLARVSVPIFFMVSGIVILGSTYDKKKYINRILRFISILAFWNLIYYFWDVFYMKYEYDIFKDIFSVFFEPIKVHLWFMYPLIGLYIAAPFIQKMVQGMDKKLENLFMILWFLFAGAVSLIGVFFESFGIETKLIYPIPIIQSSYWLGYFVIGYILYKRLILLQSEKRYNKLLLLTFLISSIITIGGTYLMSLYIGKFYEDLYIYRSLFIMISGISLFCYVVINSERILKPAILWLVKVIAPYSFGIYLSHLIFYNILVKEFDILKFNGVFAIPIFVLMIFIFSYSSVFIMKKVPLLRKVV